MPVVGRGGAAAGNPRSCIVGRIKALPMHRDSSLSAVAGRHVDRFRVVIAALSRSFRFAVSGKNAVADGQGPPGCATMLASGHPPHCGRKRANGPGAVARVARKGFPFPVRLDSQ